MKPKRDPVSPGQRSVWDFPRPAVAEPCNAHVRIEHRGMIIADTRASICTFETSHPPSYYIPPEAVTPGVLRRGAGSSFCEWKGAATYWDVVVGHDILSRIGWSYPHPTPSFAALRNHIAFYAGAFDRCTIDGETVLPQAGAFYGGWITSAFAGPFKGGPGTIGW